MACRDGTSERHPGRVPGGYRARVLDVDRLSWLIAVMTLIVGTIFLRDTKDVDIDSTSAQSQYGGSR